MHVAARPEKLMEVVIVICAFSLALPLVTTSFVVLLVGFCVFETAIGVRSHLQPTRANLW
jgi:hypothetical protein|eukprot:COSAG01_NODE_8284_length_2844_cov_4.311840_3_plen_60_part_00